MWVFGIGDIGGYISFKDRYRYKPCTTIQTCVGFGLTVLRLRGFGRGGSCRGGFRKLRAGATSWGSVGQAELLRLANILPWLNLSTLHWGKQNIAVAIICAGKWLQGWSKQGYHQHQPKYP